MEETDTKEWKSGVPRSILALLAGFMWIGSAIILNAISYSWLKNLPLSYALEAVAAGFVCALIIHHFGFLRLVDKNMARILAMQGRCRVFSFMSLKSYILVIVMICLGVLLRHSPIPRLYLAVLYSSIGTALILSSVRYLRYALALLKKREVERP